MLRIVRMITHFIFDGEPGELKGSRPVLGGGKSEDNIKGLPIAIFRNSRDDERRRIGVGHTRWVQTV